MGLARLPRWILAPDEPLSCRSPPPSPPSGVLPQGFEDCMCGFPCVNTSITSRQASNCGQVEHVGADFEQPLAEACKDALGPLSGMALRCSLLHVVIVYYTPKPCLTIKPLISIHHAYGLLYPRHHKKPR